MLQAQDLRVVYPVPLAGFKGWFRKGEFVAVQGASFTLPQGQTLGVVGESGSGKSTLALAALGLLPHGGQLQVKGQGWSGNALQNSAPNKALRQVVQVVFQDPFSSLSPRLTVEEIVGEGLLVHAPGLSAAERRRALRRQKRKCHRHHRHHRHHRWHRGLAATDLLHGCTAVRLTQPRHRPAPQ